MPLYNRCNCLSCNDSGPEPFTLKMLWEWIKFYFSHKPTTNEKIQAANEKLLQARQKVMALVDAWSSMKDDAEKSNAAVRAHLDVFRDALVLPTDNIHIVQEIRELLDHPETLEFIPLRELEIEPESISNSGYRVIPQSSAEYTRQLINSTTVPLPHTGL